MVNFALMHSKSSTIGKPNKQSYSSPNYYSPATPATSASASSSSTTPGYNKSSSYPNFSSNGMHPGSHHHSYHRHSVSNLITITPSQTTASIVTTPSTSHLHQSHKSTTAINFIAPKTKPSIASPQLPHPNTLVSLAASESATGVAATAAAAAIATKLSQNNNNLSTNNANLGRAIFFQ